MSETRLNVSNVSVTYEKFSVEDIDFVLESGDIMGLVGKSGSGKSTLIKSILGIKEPDKGTIWAEKDREEQEIRRITGYSPQENSLYPFLNLQENLNLFGEMRGLSDNEIDHRSKKLLKELEIFEAKKKRVSNLSGGMKKRADLACSMLHNPEIIILDEPFTGIDPPQRQIIWENLENLAESGKIVVITSHLLKDIVDKCNKFGLIHDGKFYRTNKIKKLMEQSDYHKIENFLNDVFRF